MPIESALLCAQSRSEAYPPEGHSHEKWGQIFCSHDQIAIYSDCLRWQVKRGHLTHIHNTAGQVRGRASSLAVTPSDVTHLLPSHQCQFYCTTKARACSAECYSWWEMGPSPQNVKAVRGRASTAQPLDISMVPDSSLDQGCHMVIWSMAIDTDLCCYMAMQGILLKVCIISH